jgi:hypothetical protein
MKGAAVLLSVLGLFGRGKKAVKPARPESGFIFCPSCGKEIHSTLSRCPYCSGFLEIVCPNCDRTSSRTLSRCPYCGNGFGKARP